MAVKVIVGAQWGDEGKGKIVDLLSEQVDIVARYQGGPNAGHTVVVKDDEIILHQLPSGILWPHVRNVIGYGVVIDPSVFIEEMNLVKSRGVDLTGRMFVSDRAHLILPYHRCQDAAAEKAEGAKRIGTTGRGIGPAYFDKIYRKGIRIGDFSDESYLRSRLQHQLEHKNFLLEKLYHEKPLDYNEILDQCLEFYDFIKDYITDTSVYLDHAIRNNESILIEGAQGTMLDVDHGTYPFVTSSNPVSGGACVGLGIGPTRLDDIWGIVKAYTTRVGMGPFPTEFDETFAEHVRKLGGEFGATTGRPRRCGWFDAVVVENAVRVNGLTGLVITKLDVLDTLDELKICTGYKINGETHKHYPASLTQQKECEPIYETHPGWKASTSQARSWEELPENARRYLNRISELLQAPVRIVSVGPQRHQTLILEQN